MDDFTPAHRLTLVRIASLYLLAGLVLGLAMGIGQDFTLMSVHSHVLLLGWATLAITGIVYLVLPRCAGTRLAAAHFWLHNLGLPVMMVSLAVEASETRAPSPSWASGPRWWSWRWACLPSTCSGTRAPRIPSRPDAAA